MKELLPPVAKNIVGRATFFSLQMVNHRVCQITVVLMRKYVTTPIDYPMDGSTFLSVQAENTTGENIKVQLTSCLTGLDLTKQIKLSFILLNAEQLNPNKINSRSAVQRYLPLSQWSLFEARLQNLSTVILFPSSHDKPYYFSSLVLAFQRMRQCQVAEIDCH